MIRACLFDLDGTLLDTLTTIAYYGNLSLAEFGYPAISKEEYKYMVGSGAKNLVTKMLGFHNAYSEENFHKIYEYYMEHYDADPSYLTEPYDGITDMLGVLCDMKIVSGVISNKPNFATVTVCREKFRQGLLSFVQGQKEGVPIKPDPQGPLSVLDSLGVSPQETIYVGDTAVDMKTGKNIGSYTVGVSWGFRNPDELIAAGADIIVTHPREITELIRDKNR